MSRLVPRIHTERGIWDRNRRERGFSKEIVKKGTKMLETKGSVQKRFKKKKNQMWEKDGKLLE